LEQHLKILRLKAFTDAGKPAPSFAALQLEPTERERFLKQVWTELGTNQTLALESIASTADTNPAAAVPAAAQAGRPPAAKAPLTIARMSLPASGRKGAGDLITTVAKRSSTAKASPRPEIPRTPDDAPLTPDQIEARLISTIEVSDDEQRDLIKRRAQAVQSFILQSGKVTAERLFIVTPKSAEAAAKGQSRVNLSLS
jgi:hypothetical protein